MANEIDNFKIVYDNLLKFDCEGEFYLALILKRRKDTKGNMVEGVNEDNRLIKHYKEKSKKDAESSVRHMNCEIYP